MVSLPHLASWVVGLLAAAGVGLGLALVLFPELKQWPTNFLQRHLFPDANQISLKKSKPGSSNGTMRKVYRILCFGDSLTEGFTRCEAPVVSSVHIWLHVTHRDNAQCVVAGGTPAAALWPVAAMGKHQTIVWGRPVAPSLPVLW
jgi:hypothetical protein